MDGIDAALVEIGDTALEILHTHEQPYPAALRAELQAAIDLALHEDIPNVAALQRRTGECFRDAAISLLQDAGVSAAAVTAIGSHGQTLRHQPNATPPFTLQVGDPDIIASGTGITTVGDFRSADIAAGGQGAPLAPLFHEWLFRVPGKRRAVLNIGGIANLTLLSATDLTVGFDTGPGNTLLDAWIRKHRAAPFDRDGAWAASGRVHQDLLRRLLGDAYFAAPPPKSTGFEYFNLRWIERCRCRRHRRRRRAGNAVRADRTIDRRCLAKICARHNRGTGLRRRRAQWHAAARAAAAPAGLPTSSRRRPPACTRTGSRQPRLPGWPCADCKTCPATCQA